LTGRHTDGVAIERTGAHAAEGPVMAAVSAISVEEFCRRYDIGRTLAFELIKTGKLPARKCGRRTLIAAEAAAAWFAGLPAIKPTAACSQ